MPPGFAERRGATNGRPVLVGRSTRWAAGKVLGVIVHIGSETNEQLQDKNRRPNRRGFIPIPALISFQPCWTLSA